MTQYNILNLKLSHSQINKIKSVIKIGTEVNLKILSKIAGDSNDENNFPNKLLLTNAQVSKLCKAFANRSTANIKLSKIQLQKIRQHRGFLGRILGPLLKTGLPLIGNALKPIAKSVLIPLGLTATALTTNAANHSKRFGSGFTTVIISNEEMNDIMKIVKTLERSVLSIKGVRKTITMKQKKRKRISWNVINGFRC